MNEAGRTENRYLADDQQETRFVFRLQTVYLQPQGLYTSHGFDRLPEGSSAYAFQFIPSLTWRAREGLAFTMGFPWEYNRSTNTVLPTLLPVPGARTEFAPGRLFASARMRVPVPDDFQSTPWIGLGYAISNSIGTVTTVKDTVDDVPQTGIEALGVGSQDIFATVQLFPNAGPRWEIAVSGEARIHMLPKWQRLYGTTAAYSVWVGRRLGDDWVVGTRFGGYRTVLPKVGVDQATMLSITPTISRRIGRNLRASVGAGTEMPGSSFNENSLQTYSTHMTLEAAF